MPDLEARILKYGELIWTGRKRKAVVKIAQRPTIGAHDRLSPRKSTVVADDEAGSSSSER